MKRTRMYIHNTQRLLALLLLIALVAVVPARAQQIEQVQTASSSEANLRQVEVQADGEYLFTATVGRGGDIQVSRGSAIADELEDAVDRKRQITVVPA